jgi:hypothetical protein
LLAENGIDILCSAIYTGSDTSRLSTIEVLHSMLTHVPQCVNQVFSHGGDEAIALVKSNSSCWVMQEACAPTTTRLQTNRAPLPGDALDGGLMYS